MAKVTSPHVLVTGHPYVDVWQAVKPAALGIAAWPVVPPGRPWKEGVCAALGVAEPADMWRHILSRVDSFADVETPLINAMETPDRLRHRARLTTSATAFPRHRPSRVAAFPRRAGRNAHGAPLLRPACSRRLAGPSRAVPDQPMRACWRRCRADDVDDSAA